MKHHDYNIFSKKELALFLQKNEENFIYITSPYDIILSEQINDILEKIDKNIKYGKALTKEYGKTKDAIKYLTEVRKNNAEWERLHKEYDRLEKLRFTKEELEWMI